MAVNLFVAVTDGDWFSYLASQPGLDEINFWQPGGRSSFKALGSGELFLFKLHSPHNFIVGGGVFAHASILPLSVAWEAFAQKNGASSLDEMRARISRYRREPDGLRSDYQIGCRILESPFFLARDQWIPVPADWSRNIVVGKTYNTDQPEGRFLWDAIQERLPSTEVHAPLVEARRYGEPVLVQPRLGQGEFRVAVMDVYRRRCAVTAERTLPVLDAAHIRPFASGGEHEINNGLLLRSDIHKLFDLGYATITPELRFEVSGRIREEFENGRDYYALHGQEVARPDSADFWPDPEALSWHNENRFRE